MKTVLVEIEDENGLLLLQDLQKLHVLRIIEEVFFENKAKLSDKYKGVFSKEDAASFDQHSQTMRNEWDNS